MTPRPSIDQVQMSTAKLWAMRSTCDRNHVGAVLSLGDRTIGSGYNGAPAGMDHCNHTLPFMPQAGTDVQYRSVSPLGPWPQGLGKPRDNGCRVAIHAECNAIAYAARHGVAVAGATMHVTLSPCYSCAQLMIAAGLHRVVYDREYRDPAGITLLREAGLKVEQYQE
jgi:dCMP deaminase